MDIALLIDKYLSDKKHLITDQDSFNIVGDSIYSWSFANIPCPQLAEVPVVIVSEVRGEVRTLVAPAEIDQYGEEITPALYSIDPDGIITPAITELQLQLINPSTNEVIIEKDVMDELERERINAEALAFLDSTDWMVVRAMERGEELSPEFKAEREAARARIVR